MVVNWVSTQIGDDGDNEAWDIKLPTFTNTKALNESDELIYHMPKKDKKEKKERQEIKVRQGRKEIEKKEKRESRKIKNVRSTIRDDEEV